MLFPRSLFASKSRTAPRMLTAHKITNKIIIPPIPIVLLLFFFTSFFLVVYNCMITKGSEEITKVFLKNSEEGAENITGS